MARFIDRVRSMWNGLSVAGRLIAVNVAVFLFLHIFGLASLFSGDSSVESAALSAISLPSALSSLAVRPWTLITYMFSQYDVLHMLFNMLWLYWFGTCFLDVREGRSLLWLYIGGGLSGALFFILSSNLVSALAARGVLIGSSASVLAVVTAAALIMPDRRLNLMFLGSIRLIWVALAMVLLDMVNMGVGNTGGHIAHLGGILAGVAYWLISSGVFRRIFNRKRPLPRHTIVPVVDPALSEQEQIDRLLDKIRKSGYASLSSSERELLFKLSERIR